MNRYLSQLLVSLAVVVPTLLGIYLVPFLRPGLGWYPCIHIITVFLVALVLAEVVRIACESLLSLTMPNANWAKTALASGSWTLWFFTVNVVAIIWGFAFPDEVHVTAPIAQLVDALIIGVSMDYATKLRRKQI